MQSRKAEGEEQRTIFAMFRVGIHAKFGEDSAEIVAEGATLTWSKLHRSAAGRIERNRGCSGGGLGHSPDEFGGAIWRFAGQRRIEPPVGAQKNRHSKLCRSIA